MTTGRINQVTALRPEPRGEEQRVNAASHRLRRRATRLPEQLECFWRLCPALRARPSRAVRQGTECRFPEQPF